MRRIEAGDVVRLYGYPGTFVAEECGGTTYGPDGFYARRDERVGFPASVKSVVEVNGRPVPLLSGPLVPPADDYPHEPTFEYDDGPASLGEDALRIWRERRGNVAAVEG